MSEERTGPMDASSGGDRTAEIEHYFARMASIDGWFAPLDARVLVAISRQQTAHGITGDLLEIGVYKGKSASLLGLLTRSGEELHVCDPFEPSESAEPSALTRPYRDATREAFEATYRTFQAEPPVVHSCRSDALKGRVQPGSFRLVHLDGSHAYDDVARDIALALELIAPGGVVCVDDYRERHTPGVALAVWEAVSEAELRAVVLTEAKLYSTKPADPMADALLDALRTDPAFEVEEHILGEMGAVVRVWSASLSGATDRPHRASSAPRALSTRALRKARAVARRTRWRVRRALRR